MLTAVLVHWTGPVPRVHVGDIQLRPSTLHYGGTSGWGHNAFSTQPSWTYSHQTCWCWRII